MKRIRKPHRSSISRQIAGTVIGVLVFILFANWFINNFFLDKYYVFQKENALIQTYRILQPFFEEGVDYWDHRDELGTDLKQICDENNISTIVCGEALDGDLQVIVKYGNVTSMGGRLWGYIRGVDQTEPSILRQNDTYTIQTVMDGFLNQEYLEMWGSLSDTQYFLLRIPVESITESVRISNEFFSIVALAGIVLGVFLSLWLSKQIIHPIRDLTELSQRMANLDFDAKYTRGGTDEIGLLGEHFNRMSDTLETVISELKTANNELKQDIEKKEKIDEMRKDFLSNVSHELKTPIALIQGYAEGLKECINDDPESREFYCDVIMDESSKMNQMVKKLLTLNQLEFGNDTVTMERFDLTNLIQGVIQSASILAQQKEAKIFFHQEEPVYVWADEFKVEEVVTNYISNALNHVDGDKVVDVKIIRQGDVIRTTVFNTGTPIPEEDLDKIWIKFYKVDKARTREYGGSGIGLSIVKAIMDSFHQKCGVKNFENGVEFWFELDGSKSENEEQPALEQKNE